MTEILFLLLGLLAGAVSGLIGIGRGVVIIPALIYGFGFSHMLAQGTTLALMVPPIGLLAAWTYYKGGHVNLVAAAFICAGFFIGGFVGAKLAGILPIIVVKRILGSTLLAISLYMIFG